MKANDSRAHAHRHTRAFSHEGTPPHPGGKQLVLIGGTSRSHDDAGRDTAVLSVDTLQWERPEGASGEAGLHSHTATSIGRNRLLVTALA